MKVSAFVMACVAGFQPIIQRKYVTNTFVLEISIKDIDYWLPLQRFSTPRRGDNSTDHIEVSVHLTAIFTFIFSFFYFYQSQIRKFLWH